MVSKFSDSHGFFEYSDSQYNVKDILGEKLFNKIENLDESYNPSRHFAVFNLVSKLIDNGEKVVIWGYFVDSIKDYTDFEIKRFKRGYCNWRD